jgi:hypothetical protein
VSFQEKSETAYSSLLALVKEKLDEGDSETAKDNKNKQNKEHKNLSFQVTFHSPNIFTCICIYI